MKKTLLLFVTLLTFLSTATAQTFENTIWNVSYMGETSGQIIFEDGIIMADFDFNMFVPVGSYTLNGDVVSVTFDDEECLEVGTYSFEITSDTLEFTLVEDPCADRIAFFTALDWVADMSTAVADQDGSLLLEIYPNPSNGELFVIQQYQDQMWINVYSLVGELVHQEQLNDVRNSIDLSSLAKGNYILQAITPDGPVSRKITLQ